MIRSVGAKYTLIGHSDNRAEGDTDLMLKNKVAFALKNNLKVIFCIGENKSEKINNKTFNVLRRQLSKVLKKKFNKNNINVLEILSKRNKLEELFIELTQSS